MRAPSYSTREIIVDFTGDTVLRKGGPAALGHNPSWVKAADYEALAAQLTDLRGERDQLQAGLEMWHGKFLAMVEQFLEASEQVEALRGAGAALRQALQAIRAGHPSGDCACQHDDEHCCVRVGEWCAVCLAAVALRGSRSPDGDGPLRATGGGSSITGSSGKDSATEQRKGSVLPTDQSVSTEASAGGSEPSDSQPTCARLETQENRNGEEEKDQRCDLRVAADLWEKLIRYVFIAETRHDGSGRALVEVAPDGEWVKFVDVQAAGAALHQQLTDITAAWSPDASAELEQVRLAYKHAGHAQADLTRLRSRQRELKACRVCFWPHPLDNDHYICPCCGTHASYEDWTRDDPGPALADGEPDGVERCRAAWDGTWWAKDIDRAPLIVTRLTEELTRLRSRGLALVQLLTRYLDNHCANADREGVSGLCECKLCKETRAACADALTDLFAGDTSDHGQP